MSTQIVPDKKIIFDVLLTQTVRGFEMNAEMFDTDTSPESKDISAIFATCYRSVAKEFERVARQELNKLYEVFDGNYTE